MEISKEYVKSIVIQYYQGDGNVHDSIFTVYIMANFYITHENIRFVPLESILRKTAEKVLKSCSFYCGSISLNREFKVTRNRMEELLGNMVAPDAKFDAINCVEKRIDITEKVIDNLENIEKGIL